MMLNPSACTTSEQVQECIDQLRAIVAQRKTPVSTYNKRYWIGELSSIEKMTDLPEKIARLQKAVAQLRTDITPSFQNIASAMYPLLEDAKDVLTELNEDYDEIGYFSPMENWEAALDAKLEKLEKIDVRSDEEEKKYKELKSTFFIFQKALKDEIERSKIRDATGKAVFEAFR